MRRKGAEWKREIFSNMSDSPNVSIIADEDYYLLKRCFMKIYHQEIDMRFRECFFHYGELKSWILFLSTVKCIRNQEKVKYIESMYIS